MTSLETALCIHSKTGDLKFLNPVKNRIKKLLGPKLSICDLDTQASHAQAVAELKNMKYGFVVILTHGSGDYLRGGEYRSREYGEYREIEKFIKIADLQLFKGKIIFCMSCASNGLAKASLEAGALAFVGFDEIPFNRFDSKGEPIGSSVLVKHCQQLLAEAIQASLELFLTGKSSLNESVGYLQIRLNKSAIEYVRKFTSVKERKEVAALLLKTGMGVKYHGNPMTEIHFHNSK